MRESPRKGCKPLPRQIARTEVWNEAIARGLKAITFTPGLTSEVLCWLASPIGSTASAARGKGSHGFCRARGAVSPSDRFPHKQVHTDRPSGPCVRTFLGTPPCLSAETCDKTRGMHAGRDPHVFPSAFPVIHQSCPSGSPLFARGPSRTVRTCRPL
jgi:hypothetical protein